MIALAYAMAAAAASVPASAGGPVPIRSAQLTIRQRVVVRVPAMPLTPVPVPRQRWKESKGPRCVAMQNVAAAALMRPDAVDLVLRGGKRLRAQLADECPSLDFYRGFYIMPSKDGMICADRDTIHNRAGQQCEIDKFRALTPQK